MEKRINYYQASPSTIHSISSASEAIGKTFFDEKLKALVELRVSQINGCAYCIDLHSNQARALGETAQRLDCLSVWREVAFYTDREKAAFGWAESVTLVSQTRVPEDVYQAALAQFSPEELVKLTAVIGLMNLWNRISISFRNAPAARP